ncbi:hypothetical protein [Aliamphritea spongicola]|uniref:hypothetical protein n=1 Tax=Aliamphritea spongicola TaxID=707589 RepID=UPI00196AC134|nr:hypothetical protein [Aliamphritea spongicola]MBN3563917.1 hypothetical protein [Aliamphritea spongicola]
MSVIQQYIRNISQQQHLTAIILPQADTAPHSTELLLASSAYTDFLASLLRCLSQNGFSFCIDSRTTGKVTIRCRPAEGPEETLNIHTEIPLSDGQIAIIDLALLDQKNLPLIAALIQQGSLETAPDRETENLFSQLPGVELHAADNSEQLSAISADIIPVIGPDGVGKTTLITAVQKKIAGNSHYYRFKKLFRGSLGYQLNHFLTQLREGKGYDKNQHNDQHGLKMMAIARRRYPGLLKQARKAGSYYFSDRFFHDYIIENLRFEDKPAALRSHWQKLLNVSPNTHWFIQLDAPADVILSRKNELSAEDIDTYREACLTMYVHRPSPIFSFINTSHTLEKCVGHLLEDAERAGLRIQ